jgi:hypothetical protein
VKDYLVTNRPYQVAAGRKVRLSAAQIEPRLYALDAAAAKAAKGGKGAVVVPRSALEFKAGEVIGLAGKITRAEMAGLQAVDGDAADQVGDQAGEKA